MHATGLRCVILMSLLCGSAWLRAQPADDPAAAPAPVQEVVVEGRHEGPRLWMVRKGDHTLWILGTISPLPKKMVWQPDAVRAVLHETQEVVPAWPTYGIGAHPLTALRVYIEWRRLQKPPDNLPLQQSLPPQLYARVRGAEGPLRPEGQQARAHAPDAGRTAADQPRVRRRGPRAAQRGAGNGAAARARAGRARAPGQAEDRRSGRRAQGRQQDPARPRSGLSGIGGDAAGERPRADAGAGAGLGARRCGDAAPAAERRRPHRLHGRRLQFRARAQPDCPRAG